MKFFDKMKIGGKIISATLALMGVLVALIMVAMSLLLMDYVSKSTESEMEIATNGIKNEVEQRKTQMFQLACGFAGNYELIRAIKANDRKAVFEASKKLVKEMNAEYLTVSDANANVIVRSYDFEKFGDKVDNQFNVKTALTGKPIAAVETGSQIKLAVRAGAPIFDETGKIIGCASTGLRLDNNHNLVDEMKKQFNADFTVFLGDTRLSTTIKNDKGERNIGTKSAPEVAETVLKQKKEFTGEAEILGQAHITAYAPLLGPDGEVIGMLFSGKSLRSAQDSKNLILYSIGGISIVIFVLISLVLWAMIRRIIVRPLQGAVRMAESISRGNLNV